MNNKKIAVIGHFGFGENLLNGQTVKTKMLAETLKDILGEENVLCTDTRGGLKTLLKIIPSLPSLLEKCGSVIMLPAHNGILFFTPLLSFFNLFYKKKLHYAVVGGWLPEFSDKHRLTRLLLRKRFDKIYTETSGMEEKLRERGFKNTAVMPNFKKIQIAENIKTDFEKPYGFCTFSRVMYEKGIEDAVEAIKRINAEAGETLVTLDIYGQTDTGYEERFEKLKKTFPQYIRYMGSVDFKKSTQVLKDYYALLFPTFYSGEGFAGTLTDAYAAGLPVIASDWRYNGETVENMKTGLLYPPQDVQKLTQCIKFLIENEDAAQKMRANCLKEAEKYLPERAVKVLLENL